MSVAMSEALATLRAFSTAASVTPTPSLTSDAMSPLSMRQVLTMAGNAFFTSLNFAKWSAVSTMIPTAPESLRMNST